MAALREAMLCAEAGLRWQYHQGVGGQAANFDPLPPHKGLVNAWFRGIREGADTVRDIMHTTLDTDAKYAMHAVVKSCKGKVRGEPNGAPACNAASAVGVGGLARGARGAEGNAACLRGGERRATQKSWPPLTQGADYVLAHLDEERSKVDVHEWRIIADAACSEGVCSGQRWGPLQCRVMPLVCWEGAGAVSLSVAVMSHRPTRPTGRRHLLLPCRGSVQQQDTRRPALVRETPLLGLGGCPPTAGQLCHRIHG